MVGALQEEPPMTARTATRMLVAAFAALSFGALTPTVRAAETTGIQVEGRMPTTITLHVAGMDRSAVRSAIHVASNDVCRAAVRIHQVDDYDAEWCAAAAYDDGMAQYRRLNLPGPNQMAADDRIVIAAL